MIAMRRGLAWLSALPLMLAGSQVAHVLVYRWVYPSSGLRFHVLVSSGHGYMEKLPVLFALAGAVVFVSLAVGVLDVVRGRGVGSLPAWAFALLPPATFVLQEVLERSLHTGTFFWQAVEAPTFLPGLALQVPFAVAAYAVARILLRTVSVVGRLLGGRRTSPRPRRVQLPRLVPLSVRVPRPAPLAGAAAGRAPPRAGVLATA
jgi:hypothetical protein